MNQDHTMAPQPGQQGKMLFQKKKKERKKTDYKARSLYPVKLSFRNKAEIKTFPEKQLRQLIITDLLYNRCYRECWKLKLKDTEQLPKAI